MDHHKSPSTARGRHPKCCVKTNTKQTSTGIRSVLPVPRNWRERKSALRFPKSSGRESLVLLVLHKKVSKQHLLPTHPFRLVVFLSIAIRTQPLADRDFWQADVLHHSPDNGQTAGFSGEGIDLIGPLPDIAKQAFNGIGAANVAMHDWRKGIKRQEMLFILDQAAHRFRIALAIF